jgi:D-inositol-3-phosphate glycosyltransferase
MLSVHGSPLARLGTPEAGGMQLYVRALSRELGRRGVDVDVFTRRVDPSAPEIVPFGSRVRVIHVDAGERGPIDKSAAFAALPQFVRGVREFRAAHQLEYDVVHSHYWLSGWVGSFLSRRWDVPHLTMFHTLERLKNRSSGEGDEYPTRAEVEERIVGSVDRIVASSDHERDALAERYGARRERVVVIPCGVDLQLFQPGNRDQARAALGVSGDVVLFVGRMDPIKGLDVLLRAVALLHERPNLTLLVVGGAGTEEELRLNRELVARLHLEERVQFRGAVPQEELPRYYNAANVCVIPSHYESFGLVAVEALACGTPVVGSLVGGLPTVIHDGVNGLLVPWRQPEAFAERIEQLLVDPGLWASFASRARQSVLGYDWAAVAKRILAEYQVLGAEREPIAACQDAH